MDTDEHGWKPRTALFSLHAADGRAIKALMSTLPSLEVQIAYAGVRYGRRHDVSYRIGWLMQMLGAGVLAVLYPLESPFYTAGIMLFELGALIAALSCTRSSG